MCVEMKQLLCVFEKMFDIDLCFVRSFCRCKVENILYNIEYVHKYFY